MKITVATLFILAATALADPRPLSKSDAETILESMGYHEAKVAYIIQGAVPMAATQNAAMVKAVGYFDGQPKNVDQQFLYDADLGWFCTQDSQNGTGIRIWSLGGYSEVAIAPRPTPPPPMRSVTPPTDPSEQAETRLNEVYAGLRAKLTESDKVALKQEQLQWLQGRDRLRNDLVRRTEMTQARIRQLEERLKQ